MLASERQSLLNRQQQLNTAAAHELARVLRELAPHLNDLEIATLFEFFDLDTATLNYQDFATSCKNILTPRRKALHRVLFHSQTSV